MDDESARSESARQYVISGPLTARLETILLVASQALAFPTVLVNIIDAELQHTVRLAGSGTIGSVARREAFCDTVVRTGHPVIVQDAAHDSRFDDFPAVRGGEVGSYIGVPLRGRENLVIGAMCTVDPAHRTISTQELRVLLQFGKIVERQLDLIRTAHEQFLADEAAAVTARALKAAGKRRRLRPLIQRAGDLCRPHYIEQARSSKSLPKVVFRSSAATPNGSPPHGGMRPT